MRKVLRNSLFAAMTAWALHGLVNSVPDHGAGTLGRGSQPAHMFWLSE